MILYIAAGQFVIYDVLINNIKNVSVAFGLFMADMEEKL